MIFEYLDVSEIKKFSFWFFWILFANLALILFQFCGYDPIFVNVIDGTKGHGDPVGFMGIAPHLGSFAAILSPLLMMVHPLLCLMALPLIFFSHNSTAVLAIVIGLLFLLKFEVRKSIWISLIILICSLAAGYIIFYDMPGGEFQRRFVIWYQGLSYTLKTSPFFGVGLGSFGRMAPITIDGESRLMWTWAHNEYLQFFFESGIFGLTILFSFIFRLFNKFKASFQDRSVRMLFASFLAILIISICHFPFHLGRFSGFCIAIIALLSIKMFEVQNET